MSVPSSNYGPSQPSASTQAERSALNKIMWFGIVQLIGLVAGWVVYFLAFGYVFSSAASLNLPQNPTPAQVGTALGPVFQEFTLVIPVSLAINLAGVLLLLIGFREFNRFDSSRFSVPSKLIYLLAIGVIFAGGAVVLLFNGLPNLIAQAPTTGTPNATFMSAVGGLLLFVGFAFIGAIIALIGLIGGEILGLWRVGSRYNDTVIKLGAIFVIIPLLNIVAPILILIGAAQVKGRLGAA